MTKKQMISVYPIRYIGGRWEHLIIKRATLSYNWQCMTGGVESDESPLEAAYRELFEETAYRT
ncbi:MAG: NUDIX domain-containing protein, partial [Candidatus Heimdallarchaeota archaeon]